MQPKLTSVQLWKYNGPDKDPFLLGLASDLSTFGFFQRGTVGEMLTFTGRTIARRTQVRRRCALEMPHLLHNVWLNALWLHACRNAQLPLQCM